VLTTVSHRQPPRVSVADSPAIAVDVKPGDFRRACRLTAAVRDRNEAPSSAAGNALHDFRASAVLAIAAGSSSIIFRSNATTCDQLAADIEVRMIIVFLRLETSMRLPLSAGPLHLSPCRTT